MDFGVKAAAGMLLAGAMVIAPAHAAVLPDHQEFDAMLEAPFKADGARPVALRFTYPGAAPGTALAWEVDALDRQGAVLRHWQGQTALGAGAAAQARLSWDGRDSHGDALPAGYATLRLRAVALDEEVVARLGTGLPAQALERALRLAPDAVQEQRQDVLIGAVQPAAMPAFQPLRGGHAAAAPSLGTQSLAAQSVSAGSLPYTIYYGNLHSQTNHSDGAGPLTSCTGEQAPQSGAYGPADAYQYALNRGLDMLMTSEHNHMFDGSTSTNTSADPATAKNLFQSGLQQASSFRAAHPSFLAVYGQEWGVISNGGHMNIFNADGLIEWEKNSAGQLIGDYEIAKGDYASLYTLMRTKGWIGQFNHPSSSGQFVVGGTNFGYTDDGDAVMVLAEVRNSYAFSTNTTETESGRSSYETAFNTILERGYHVAPSSDQDNHCANWGASFTNRTGVLIPNGTALDLNSFLDALRARRVFATEDKNAQIVLTANGHVMGERFSNSGPLTLTVNYASSTGHSVQRVQVFEGVPGSNGTVTTTSETATTTITPTTGTHFYYAKITQDDGLQLWSAPVWITQGSGGGSGDTTAPTVSASESGSSGTITLSASASDNVGVTRVEFYVDGALKATDTASPYQASLDSTTLADGSHSLVAKAYDAAGNVGSSSAVSFSTSNGSGGTATELIKNGGFESGATSWTQTSGAITSDSGEAAHAGSWKAWLDGYGSSHTDYVRQSIAIPATATKATLDFFLHVDTAETSTSTAYDTLKAQIITSSGSYVTLGTWSNLDAGSGYVERTLDLTAYRGQTIQVNFYGVEDSSSQTSFVVDDVSVKVQ
ncbi:CehA/McbA family metallohydrolase [Frateuria defendens]|uniref:CehA/McbA family metallohydrolase n=1 Tax=Frateuria defendens TaxID=2219559 RepID=UPI00066FC88D|nr:CehA/McbA family metallohydrolase [Frateuria defendens]